VTISISAASRLVAHANPPRITLGRVVGGFELVFTLNGMSVARTQGQPVVWLRPDLARIAVGSGSQELGSARPDHALPVRTLNAALPMNYDFRMALPAQQLAAVEAVRSGGDLPFRLSIAGTAGSENDATQVELFQIVLTQTVSRSDWIQQLQASKAADILLLEIPMPFVDPPNGLGGVANLLRQAQALFLDAHYTESVIACRKAVEAFEKVAGRDRDGLLKLLATTREGLTKDQRRTTIEAAFYHFGSLAAHDGAAVFDRRDARLALALTAALVAYEMT
jgi:hypothetical protein